LTPAPASQHLLSPRHLADRYTSRRANPILDTHLGESELALLQRAGRVAQVLQGVSGVAPSRSASTSFAAFA
jgi:hypothetical protein